VPPDVLIQEVQGESVLLNLNSGRYFGLDDIGTRMWQLITTSPSLQGAYETLLAEYDVGADRLQQDLQNLIGKLAEHGLVEIKDH
jgi:hypothetical protein